MLTACSSSVAPAGPQAWLTKLPAPDDLIFDSQGRLLFSDINAGTVSAVLADGSIEKVAGGLSEPEGMVVQPDGRILVAEQGHNRIDIIDAQSHSWTVWRNFANHTSNAGIDGIGPRLPDGDVLVPDSPNGTLWRVSADGKTATQVVAGMVRPVGAAVDGSGRIFVADEGGALWVLDPSRRRFAILPTPDDVQVGRDGHIFVNTLGDNAIHELDGQGHQVGVMRGVAQPQGIVLDTADNLYYTEFTAGRIDRVVRSFLLDAPKATRLSGSTFIICPSIQRAATFTQPLTLSAAPATQTTILRVLQPGVESSGALEVRTTQSTLHITVAGPAGPSQLSLSQSVALAP